MQIKDLSPDLILTNGRFYTLDSKSTVTREEALCTYTTNGTWITREANIKGAIEAGKVGDLVVLDRDYFSFSDEEIKDI